MFGALWTQREETLVTFGDALASWLDYPDDTTTDRCLQGKDGTVYDGRTGTATGKTNAYPATIYLGLHARRWHVAVAVSKRYWLSVILLCLVTVVTGGILFGIALRDLASNNYNKLITEGFGEVRPGFFLDTKLPTKGPSGLIFSVLVANTPQVIASLCYLFYNSLLTAMHMSREYSAYAIQRNHLRVTTPKGEQRSTYWLQLPFAYGIPLAIASSILHWLISQSIFLARVATRWDGVGSGRVRMAGVKSNQSALGISLAPMLASIMLASCLLVTVMGLSFRRLKSNMPVAGSCSLALAAATHRPREDVDASKLSVIWGEVTSMGDEDVGHCCFTSQEVVHLTHGRRYAGGRSVTTEE